MKSRLFIYLVSHTPRLSIAFSFPFWHFLASPIGIISEYFMSQLRFCLCCYQSWDDSQATSVTSFSFYRPMSQFEASWRLSRSFLLFRSRVLPTFFLGDGGLFSVDFSTMNLLRHHLLLAGYLPFNTHFDKCVIRQGSYPPTCPFLVAGEEAGLVIVNTIKKRPKHIFSSILNGCDWTLA